MQKNRQTKNNIPIWFGVIEPVKSFTGREKELYELHELVKLKRGLAVISQMATVSGAGGIGKSELARKYAYIRRNDFNNNVAWMNAKTQESLRESFLMLAEDLKIPTTEEREGKERDRDIKSVVKDVYKYFTKAASLFIFDNAEKYKDISEFLPSSFSLFPDDKEFYVLITSRNQDWEVGEEGEIGVIKLNEFTPQEAVDFIKKLLNIENDLQNEHTEKLAKELQYFPLALRQAVTYIKETNKKSERRGHKKFETSDYLKKYKKDAKELLEFSHDSDRYAKTTFITWKITLENIMKIGDNGKEALEILKIMAYFTPDNIPIEGFFSKLALDEQIIGEERSWKAVELLNQYSMINLEKGVSNIHRLVQQIIRLQNQSKEEEILEKSLKLINSSDIAESHIASVWDYTSKYDKLIDEFYFNSFYGRDEKTPLHLLAQNGHSKAIEAILTHIEEKKGLNVIRNIIYTPTKSQYRPYTPFQTAINNGNLDVTKVFLEKGADAKAADKDKDTPLHWAAINGHLDVVKYLVEKGADVEAVNGDGRTPLHWAAEEGYWDVVKYLAEIKGANPKAANKYGSTPLHWAARYGKLDVVKYLVEEKDAHAKATEENGDTPLHWAAITGHLNVVKYLVEKGADVKAVNRYEWTPLHRAARYGNLGVVKYLVDEKGADVKATDKNGWTPLHLAAENNHWDVVKYLVEKCADAKAAANDDNAPLHWAAEEGHWDVVKYLVKEKGDVVKATNEDGSTLLHWVAGNLDIVKYLVEEKGADAKAADKYGKTPLHWAAGYGNLDVVKYLVEKGADAKAAANDGNTPLHWAAGYGNLDVVKYLVEKGANVTAAANDGNTSLHWAAGNGKWDVVKYLVEEKGADVTAAANDGNTSLHWAAGNGKWDVVKFLVEKGADIKATNNEGGTHLHWAAINCKLGAMKYLVEEKGADVKAAHNDGNTPLHRAARYSKWDAVKYLVEKCANGEATANDGKTAEEGHWNVVKYLIKKALMLRLLTKMAALSCTGLLKKITGT
jgi:ankyrin repeat protein